MQETFHELVAEASAAGRTVLLSSHILPEVQRACGRAALVREGRPVTVERVAALREARARRIRVTLEPALSGAPRGLGPADRWNPRWQGDRAELLVPPKDITTTLRQLLTLPVRDITVEEAGLTEAFLDPYRDPARAQARDDGPQTGEPS
ncbi:hypothetical protein SNE510_63940 [Streptomyces sp. NE5-10]|uniref:hypothetical protein n=1 Tax=Streptomyces sp. NE5-10 TaxID=2759674 RepID=UPI001905092A|nr:hypothetical protein [Streptomyces sp. NE5-10]GHJ96875.1 hypothetical protein SNE510_63940 [Streptomyces sp. NE5-10]